MVRALDVDGSGCIDFEEFVAMQQRRYDDMHAQALDATSEPERVYLIAAFDQWTPFEMERVALEEFDCHGEHQVESNPVLFACARMAPPGQVQYAFVVDNDPVYAADQGVGLLRTGGGAGSAANAKVELPSSLMVNVLTVAPREEDQTIKLAPRVQKAEKAEVSST